MWPSMWPLSAPNILEILIIIDHAGDGFTKQLVSADTNTDTNRLSWMPQDGRAENDGVDKDDV